MQLYTAEQVRELDRIAIEEQKIPSYELMQRAAMAAFVCLKKQWPDAKNILLVCGGGNNAGDGFVLASLAQRAGLRVSVVLMYPADKLKGDAQTAYQDMVSTEINPSAFSSELLDTADVVVDALLGTGLDRMVEGQWFDIIAAINTASAPVLSIDIPSGLNANTGMPMGISMNADVVMSFIGQKRGLYSGYAKSCYKKLFFTDLSVPATVYSQVTNDCELKDYQSIKPLLKSRLATAHKGQNGHVLCIGGDYGHSGAIRMAAEAALRSGAGLVSVATRSKHVSMINQSYPELMSHAVNSYQDLEPLLEKSNVILIGPGLGQSDWAKQLMARVREEDKPSVFDADGLNLLACDPDSDAQRVITPHPGEAARLNGSDVTQIQSERFSAVQRLKEKYGGTVILKGSGTLISSQSGCLQVCAHGNPGMASGGMGDVLSGIIAALLAQDYERDTAALIGTVIHSYAADLLADKYGEIGLLATDLMPVIRSLLNKKSQYDTD